MIFTCASAVQPLTAQWCDALSPLVIRHHDPACDVEVVLTDASEPMVAVAVLNPLDTARATVVRLPRLGISTTTLTYFPGLYLARAWFAVAWASYIQHEALELVTLYGNPKVRCIDPHEPFPTAGNHRLSPYPHDRGLRDGYPVRLTPETLLAAFATAMDRDVARALVGELAHETDVRQSPTESRES